MRHSACTGRCPHGSRVLLAVLILVLPIRAATGDCSRVVIRDADTQHPIVGAEDLAIDRIGRRVYVAAFDRWALEDALYDGAEQLPQGGLYAIPFERLIERPRGLNLHRVTGDMEGDFHPHGISLYRGPEGTFLHVINHVHERRQAQWRRSTRIETFRVRDDGDLQHIGGIANDRLCRANDLAALSASELLVTRDHGACSAVGQLIENVFGLRRAQILLARSSAPWSSPSARLDIAVLADDIGLANGIALEPGHERLAVAATREKSVRIYDTHELLHGHSTRPVQRLTVPGGPDNLTWSNDGLIAALHPSLTAAGMARHRWFGRRRSGTRLVRIAPGAAPVKTLFDDPDGTQFNAGTVAAGIERTLVAGSALAEGLLVCTPRSQR